MDQNMKQSDEQVLLDFRTLEELGVVAEINSRILHPLGLSLKWDEVTNIGEGCEVCANGMWNYTTPQDVLRKRRENFKKFVDALTRLQQSRRDQQDVSDIRNDVIEIINNIIIPTR